MYHERKRPVALIVSSVTQEICMEGSKLGIMNGLFIKIFEQDTLGLYDMIHFLQTQGSVVAPQTSTSSASKPPHQVQL